MSLENSEQDIIRVCSNCTENKSRVQFNMDTLRATVNCAKARRCVSGLGLSGVTTGKRSAGR